MGRPLRSQILFGAFVSLPRDKSSKHAPLLPVVPAQALYDRKPDYVVLLAWNLADEIVRQQADYLRAGGRFVVPVPDPHVIAGGLPS